MAEQWGGFVRTRMTGGNNTVIAGHTAAVTPLEAETVDRSDTVLDKLTKSSTTLIIPESLSKEDRIKYLVYCKDFLTTQLAMIEQQLLLEES